MRVFRDQMVCEGNLFDQYDAIEDFFRKHMFLSGTMDQKASIGAHNLNPSTSSSAKSSSRVA